MSATQAWRPPNARRDWSTYALDGETYWTPPRRHGPSRRALARFAATVAVTVSIGAGAAVVASAGEREPYVRPPGFEQRSDVQGVDREQWIERGVDGGVRRPGT